MAGFATVSGGEYDGNSEGQAGMHRVTLRFEMLLLPPECPERLPHQTGCRKQREGDILRIFTTD
jgi:hypothetical protein